MKKHSLKNLVKSTGLMILASTMLFSVSSAEEDIEAIKEEMELLKTQMTDLELLLSQGNPVTTFDSIRLDLGGFVHQTFTSILNSENDEASFDRTEAEIFVGADVTQNDSIFAVLKFVRESHLEDEDTAEDVSMRAFEERETEVEPEFLFYNHTFSDELDVTIGRFVNPWGIINQLHFPPLLMNASGPLFLGGFEGATVIPTFMEGIQFHGNLLQPDYGLEYHAYVANFGESPDEFIFGGRLAASDPGKVVTVGASYQHGDRDDDTYDVYGLDVEIAYEGFGLYTEYVYNDRDMLGDQESLYVQPFYRVGSWLGFYRYDMIDLDDDTSNDASEKTEHIVGVNYLFTPAIRFRGEYAFNMYELENDELGQDRDFDTLQFSVTVSF